MAGFKGFRAIVYEPRLAEDAEACQHVIEGANAKNSIHGSMTLVEKLPRAQESHHATHNADRF